MPPPGDTSYHEKAEYCSEMAAEAPTADLREKWLNLAAVWLSMAQNRMVQQRENIRSGDVKENRPDQ